LGGNATYAAIDAGYARKWANNQGYRLMRQPGLRSLRPTSAKAPAGQRQVCGGQARSTESFYTMANEKFFELFPALNRGKSTGYREGGGRQR